MRGLFMLCAIVLKTTWIEYLWIRIYVRVEMNVMDEIGTIGAAGDNFGDFTVIAKR